MEATWKIVQLECYPQFEGETDVVFTVHWRVEAQDGEYSASVYGSTGLTLDKDSTFTPYSSLTEGQVVGWVTESLGAEQVAAIGKNISDQIEDQKNPKVTKPTLPW